MTFKQCQFCGENFSPKPYEGVNTKRWKNRVYCSAACVCKVNSKVKRTVWNKGVSPSLETREKISRTLKGRQQPHVGESNKNRTYSAKTKKLRSETAKKLWGNPEFVAKMKGRLSGENNPNWKKDRLQLVKNEKKHLCTRYKNWMLAVKKRDGWKCRIDNKDCNGSLEAHHILSWRDHHKLRYDTNNGITLCQAHHPKGDAKEKRLAPLFMEMNKQLTSVSSD